ncbi:FAD-dependent monooxygenase [Advenella mimigardefordensis]|uniref:Ubiquinone biosynthesis hydroxylase, UbiH/UbiF/VisC/COQ6 family n=1 Tax=Advenella mimigardefordensis (strain DSM 17166 / LMG 22922 / DPN7) TaxID=1247726 RepID=W0PC65_ADVMD|nr:FAD-dependent monooxygenase [Advenella mimigardefordensis]AHG62643.1 ubiquinone biosynthesis hydroxylase, UbiH/UbiF/VisC/COQ6 family [Advenella mimigardefordensis DPN7]
MKHEVIVCGAGIAGMTTALALTRAGVDVALLAPKKVSAPMQAEQYHPRVYAISEASQALLASLGIWGAMPQERITPVDAMQVHGDRDGQVVLDAWQAAKPHLAWIVESGEIERALFQALTIYGVPWLDDTLATWQPGQVTTTGGVTVQAQLFIGADGARSPLRSAAAMAHQKKDYGDQGLVTHLTCEKPHLNTAYQWFRNHHVLAFLPMPDTSEGHQVSLVWSVDDATAARYLEMDEATLARALPEALNEVAQGCLGALKVRARLHGFPLTLEKAQMVATGVALVGDAAHRVHPLAGQGLNLGLGDVKVLTQVLNEKEAFRSYGDLRVLERYARTRAADVLAMRVATDGLYQLFARDLPALPFLRNAGMKLVQQLPWVKRQLIAGAAGS